MKFSLSLFSAVAGLFFLSAGCISPDDSGTASASVPAQSAKQKIQYFSIRNNPVFLSERASLIEFTAAEEMRTALAALSHTSELSELNMQNDFPEKTSVCRIVIGELDSPILRKVVDRLKIEKSDDDVIVQAVIDGNLVLSGSSPRAVLYSVYDFLQNQMGVRWMFDGEEGTFYTKNSGRIPENFYRRHQGGFRFRNMGTVGKTGFARKQILARNYMHVGDFCFGGERYYGGESIQPYRSDYKEHPEYFALLDGVRYLPPPTGWCWVINGCWSNPGFTDLCIRRIKDGIRTHKSNHISIHPADSARRCECEECRKLIDPDASSRWYKYHAGIVRELKKEFPNLRYSVLAYQEYREVPAAPVEEVEFVEYCQYSRCFVHTIGNPDCATNHTDFERLRRWEVEKGIPMGVWDYTFDVFSSGYNLPMYRFFADEILNFYNRKFVKLFIEGGPSVAFSRPARWVAMQMMWDPGKQTADEWLADYCKTVYGPGWKTMLAFHQACADAWNAMPTHLTSCFNNPAGTSKLYLTESLMKHAESAFAEAEMQIGKIRTDDRNPAAAARKLKLKQQYLNALAFEKKTFEKWKDLRKKAMSSSMALTAYQETFTEMAEEQGTALKGHSQNPRLPVAHCVIGWNEKEILFRISVVTADGIPVSRMPFRLCQDGKLAYGNESVELFIQAPGSSTYYQFAAGKNGDYYDGEGLNGNWNGDWNYTVTYDKNNPAKCVFEIRIPFKNFNRNGPGTEPWKMVIIRNGTPDAVGIPYPAHHDIGAGADVTFSTGRRPAAQ